jgi:hypothetical protein
MAETLPEVNEELKESIKDNRERLQKSMRAGLLNVKKSIDSLHDTFKLVYGIQKDAYDQQKIDSAFAREQAAELARMRGGVEGGIGAVAFSKADQKSILGTLSEMGILDAAGLAAVGSGAYGMGKKKGSSAGDKADKEKERQAKKKANKAKLGKVAVIGSALVLLYEMISDSLGGLFGDEQEEEGSGFNIEDYLIPTAGVVGAGAVAKTMSDGSAADLAPIPSKDAKDKTKKIEKQKVETKAKPKAPGTKAKVPGFLERNFPKLMKVGGLTTLFSPSSLSADDEGFSNTEQETLDKMMKEFNKDNTLGGSLEVIDNAPVKKQKIVNPFEYNRTKIEPIKPAVVKPKINKTDAETKLKEVEKTMADALAMRDYKLGIAEKLRSDAVKEIQEGNEQEKKLGKIKLQKLDERIEKIKSEYADAVKDPMAEKFKLNRIIKKANTDLEKVDNKTGEMINKGSRMINEGNQNSVVVAPADNSVTNSTVNNNNNTNVVPASAGRSKGSPVIDDYRLAP